MTLGSRKESRLLAMLEASSKVVEYNKEREDGLVVDEEVDLISNCFCCSRSVTVRLVQFEEDLNTTSFLTN